jgi:hypothetical protein
MNLLAQDSKIVSSSIRRARRCSLRDPVRRGSGSDAGSSGAGGDLEATKTSQSITA